MPGQASLGLAVELRPHRVVMDSMIRLPPSTPESVLQRMRDAATFDNPEYLKMRALGRYLGNTPRHLHLWADLDDGSLDVPRGLTDELRAALRREGMRVEWDDRRVVAPLEQEFAFAPPWEDRDYQLRLVTATQRHQNVLFEAPVASGKTCFGLLLMALLKQRMLVILGRRQLARQWVKDCRRFLGFTPRTLGFGNWETDPRSSPLTIASQPALYRDPWRESDHFGVLFLDEAQHGSSRTHVEVIRSFPARYRVAVSDDSTRHDKAEAMTYAHFGRVRDRITVEELVAAGKMLPVVLRVVPTGWMPAGEDGLPLPPGALDWTRRSNRQMRDAGRNDFIGRWILRTMDLDCSGLVLGYRVEHAIWFQRALSREGLKCGLLLGGKKYEGVFDRSVVDLDAGTIPIAAGTIGSVGEGFNVPRLDRGYLVSAGAHNAQALKQMCGRFMRVAPNKSLESPPVVYFFLDGLRVEHPELSGAENGMHRGWIGGQIKSLQSLVRKNRARFARAEILNLDGATWSPLLREDRDG